MAQTRRGWMPDQVRHDEVSSGVVTVLSPPPGGLFHAHLPIGI
ncbi:MULTISPECIES: hypothetical protein [Agrobacterium]|nr:MULTISPECIES: hypothetical protein [Agrobacterium]